MQIRLIYLRVDERVQGVSHPWHKPPFSSLVHARLRDLSLKIVVAALSCVRSIHQERARLADPLKAKAKKRLVMGLREVLRGIKAGKVRSGASAVKFLLFLEH